MQMTAPTTWVDVAYRLLQLIGFVAAVKIVLWLYSFREDVKTIKDNHLTHIQESQQMLVEQGHAQLEELRELRQDFRTYFSNR